MSRAICRGTVVDALELKIPPGVQMGNVTDMMREETTAEIRHRVAAGWHAIVRPSGHPVVLHFKYCRGVEYRKLSFVSASALTYAVASSILGDLVDGDISLLPIARIDFAVDVAGMPVEWFRNHLVAPRKRFTETYGQFTKGGQREAQTLYLGKRPNCLRIYNKSAEQAARKRYICESGVGNIVTRIERVCAGNGLPEGIQKFGDIPRALELGPFNALRYILTGPPASVTSLDSTATQHLARLGFQTLVDEVGAQEATRRLNRLSRGNAARIRRALGVEMARSSSEMPDLDRLYRESVARQLFPDMAVPGNRTGSMSTRVEFSTGSEICAM